MYLGLVSYFGKVSKQQFVTTNPQIGLDTKVNELNKLSTQILYFVEYLLYSLHNKLTNHTIKKVHEMKFNFKFGCFSIHKDWFQEQCRGHY